MPLSVRGVRGAWCMTDRVMDAPCSLALFERRKKGGREKGRRTEGK